MLRVMVVGLGTMGAVHASSFMKMNDTKLTAVVDVKEERANEWGEKSGAKSFYSFDEAIREIGEEIDVISICVPTDLHPALVKKSG